MPEDSDSSSGHHDVHCSEKNCYAAGHGFGRDDGKPYCRVHMSDHMKEPPKSKTEGNGIQNAMGKGTPTFKSDDLTTQSFKVLKQGMWGSMFPGGAATQAAHEARLGAPGATTFAPPKREPEEEQQEDGDKYGDDDFPDTLGHEIADDQAEQHEQLTQGGQEGVTGPMDRFRAWNAEREPEWAARLGARLRGG